VNKYENKFRKYLSLIFFVLTIGFILYICAFKVMDRDFWWHIKAGELIWQHKSLIETEPFAYTRLGLPYLTNYEWLSQVILYLVHHLAGINGIILLRGILIAITFSLLLFIDRKNIFINSLLVIWVANLARPGYMARPQLFTYICFAAYIHLAFRYIRTKSRKILYAFLLIQILWTNLHGAACLMGYAIFGLLFLHELFESTLQNKIHFDQKSLIRLKQLFLTGLGLIIVSILTPNTYHNLTYLYNLLNDRTIAFIGEWKPRQSAVYLKELGPLWAVTVFTILMNKRKNLFSIGLFLFTGYLSLKAFRHEMLFDFASLGIIIFNLRENKKWQDILDSLFVRKYALIPAAVSIILLMGVFSHRKYITMAREHNLFGLGAFAPAKGACDFLEKEDIQGNMFNTYGIGGYLMYQGYPDRKIYIDGRNVDYGFEFMNRTYFAGTDQKLWNRLEEEHSFHYAIIDYGIIREKTHIPYCKHFDKKKDWKLVYIDDWVALYLKDIPRNKPVIDTYAYRLLSPEHFEYRARQTMLINRQPPSLEEELQRAVSSSPENTKARLMLARLYLRSQRIREARTIAHSVIKEKPYCPEGYETLAAVHVAEENWKDAGICYEKAIKTGGNTYQDINYEYVAAIFDKAGNTSRARYYMHKALHSTGQQRERQVPPAAPEGTPAHREVLAQDMPQKDLETQKNLENILQELRSGLSEDIDNHIEQGVTYAEQGLLQKAKEEFKNALQIDPGYPAALSNLGAVYHQEGNLEQAIIYYQKALERKPDYADAHYNLALANYQLGNYQQAWQHTQQADSLGRDTRWLKKRLSTKMDNYPSRSRRSQE